MNVTRAACIVIMLAVLAPLSQAQVKTPGISEKAFRYASLKFFDDPLAEEAKEAVKIMLAFAMKTKKAEVVLGKRELEWFGKEKNKDLGVLLLAAYIAGNTQAQLDSGVRGDDTYAGLLKMFRVYRLLKDEKDFKNEAVEKLLKLQKEGKLLEHVIKMNKEREKEMKKSKKLDTHITPRFLSNPLYLAAVSPPPAPIAPLPRRADTEFAARRHPQERE